MQRHKYKPLSLDTLLALPDQLSKLDEKNPQRFSFVILLKHLAMLKARHLNSKEAIELLTSALTFEMEYIHEIESYGYSPNKDQDQSYFNWFFKTGSDMYTGIKAKIHPRNNPLPHDQRFIYLNKLYQFIEKNLTNAEIKKFSEQRKNFFWKNKEELLKQITSVLNKIKEKIATKVDIYVNAAPLSDVLQKNIRKTCEEYVELNKNRGWLYQNKQHESLMKFFTLIEQTCHFESENRADDIQSCAGLYVLMAIGSEFKYLFLYPEGSRIFNKGSEAYKKCLHILNKENLKDINQTKRVDLLRELVTHISFIKNRHNDEIQAKCKALNFTDLDKFHKELEQRLHDEETKKDALSWTATAFKYVVEYSIGFAAAVYTADVALPALIGGATGPIGFVACLAGETIIISGLEKSVIDYVCKWTLDKIGAKIVAQATTAATYTYNVTKEGLQKFFNHSSLSDEDREDIVEWIVNLLTLPEKVLSRIEKDRIRNAFGINNQVGLSEEDQIRNVVGICSVVKNRIVPMV